MPLEHFKNKEDYRRWTAYRHMHDIAAPHLKEVDVGGKRYKVNHSKRRKLRRKGGKRK